MSPSLRLSLQCAPCELRSGPSWEPDAHAIGSRHDELSSTREKKSSRAVLNASGCSK